MFNFNIKNSFFLFFIPFIIYFFFDAFFNFFFINDFNDLLIWIGKYKGYSHVILVFFYLSGCFLFSLINFWVVFFFVAILTFFFNLIWNSGWYLFFVSYYKKSILYKSLDSFLSFLICYPFLLFLFFFFVMFFFYFFFFMFINSF